MNFYKRHLGDYAKGAGHLSMIEHGAYTLLLDRYYTTEQPIPSLADAHRVCRARSRDEKAAVDTVLREFFHQSDGDGYRNKRAEEEIAKAAHQRSVNQEQGKRGGRPRKTDSVLLSETDSGTRSGTESVSGQHPNGNPSQTPDSISQKREKPSASSSAERTSMPTIPCPYQAIVELYHAKLSTLPRCRLMPKVRQAALRKMWGWVLSSTKSDGARRATTADEALQWLGDYFARAAENDFLMGRTPRSAEHANWRCDLDFLLTDRGMKQVIEKTLEQAA